MRTLVALSVLAAMLAAGCGGGDERSELEAPATTAEATPETRIEAPTPTRDATGARVGTARAPSARQRKAIASQADATAAALVRWDDAYAACIGPSGTGDAAGASCTRGAWEQLFRQLHVVHVSLLRLIGRAPTGPCHEALGTAIDAIHGFLSGATPTNVVWLDEQQRPPSRFDLEAIADLARPAPALLRDAAAERCAP